MKKINFQYLSQLLEYKREDYFIKELVRYLSSNEQNANLILAEISPKGSLLHIAIRNQLLHGVEVLVQHGADVNATTKTRQSAALLTCEVGDWKILEFLLRNPNLHLEADQKPLPFLCTVVRHMRERITLNTDHTKCFHLLVGDGRICLNATDEFGNTALHYAVRNRSETIVYELLNRGAYIAVNNNRGESPLLHFDYEMLSKYMDRCMEEGQCPAAEGGIQFNYQSLVPPEDVIVPDANEMTAIDRMTENKELRSLVAHPFIAMFISIKWSGFSLFFNLNLLVYSLFCITLLMYSTLCYIYDDSYSYSLILWFTVFATYSYVCLITFMNLLLVPQHTVRLFRCYVELVLIGLAFMILFLQQQSLTTRRIVTGATVAMSGIELLLLIHTIQSQFVISSLSHVKTFLMTLIHSFVLYCILIVVFSLSFWTNQIHGSSQTVVMMANGTQPVVLTHLSPIARIVRNAVHIMGEFDSSKVDLYAYAVSYFVIFLFLVFVVIIIFNVFNKFMYPYETFCDVTGNLLIKAWHLHKTEELLGKFRCTYNMRACLPRTLSLPYFIMAKMVRMFSYDSQSVLIVCPQSPTHYRVIIPGRISGVAAAVGGGESGTVPPPPFMNKRVEMDRTAFQEARLTLEHRQSERTREQTQEEQYKIMQRLEYKLDVLMDKAFIEAPPPLAQGAQNHSTTHMVAEEEERRKRKPEGDKEKDSKKSMED